MHIGRIHANIIEHTMHTETTTTTPQSTYTGAWLNTKTVYKRNLPREIERGIEKKNNLNNNNKRRNRKRMNSRNRNDANTFERVGIVRGRRSSFISKAQRREIYHEKECWNENDQNNKWNWSWKQRCFTTSNSRVLNSNSCHLILVHKYTLPKHQPHHHQIL